MILLTAIVAGGLLVKFIYCLIAILMVGCLIWSINTYIAPIPPPALMIVGLIAVLFVLAYMLGFPTVL